MLKIILKRLKPQAERIIAEEQAGFRAGRSTSEQIFNLRIPCEKYFQHKQDHVFIDFKKTFDRVWHVALWATMKNYNISANLIRVIEHPNKATSAVLLQQQHRRPVPNNSWESDRDVYSHPHSPTYFWKGS